MRESRVAVIAVHGIGPAQHYALQDEVAENLAGTLPGLWEKSAFFPPNHDASTAAEHSTALRLQRSDEDDTIYDVYEAYWSPIDKNRTSVASVLSWLLNALFAPLNAVTPLPARGAKLAFDLGYVFALVCLVFALPLGALATFTLSYADVSADRATNVDRSPLFAIHALHANWRILQYGLQADYIVSLLSGVLGWYIVAHVIASMVTARADRHFSWQQKMRFAAIALGALLIGLSWMAPVFSNAPFRFGWQPLLLLGGALLIRLAVSLAKGFFVNRLGDIQIYTTADNNSAHYDLRNRILDTVRAAIARVLLIEEGGAPYYERVYVVAHSLGSTIAMDALIQIHQEVEAGNVRPEAWERIKAFITLGTALEKTRFFFSARNPTLTESFLHWRNDVYGKLFSRDPRVLDAKRWDLPHAIFWANYWYFRDIVANRIVTYHLAGVPDGRDDQICYNVRLRERGSVLVRPWVHSDYVGDVHFWNGIDYKGLRKIGVAAIICSELTHDVGDLAVHGAM